MGSSGGGSSSGKVDYPTYIKHVHGDWLAGIADPASPTSHDTIDSSLTEVMNAALGASPFTAMTVFDPDTDLTALEASVTALLAYSYSSVFDGYEHSIVGSSETAIAAGTDFATILAQVVAAMETSLISTTEVDADIDAFGDLIDAQIEATVLPRFRRGMQDINAVVSSSFVIGEALIESDRNKEVIKYGTGLRVEIQKQKVLLAIQATLQALTTKLQAFVHDKDIAYRMATSDLEFRRAVTLVLADTKKIKWVAKKEELETQMTIDEKDAKWDLEVFTAGHNMLAGVAGGASQLVPKQDKLMSALGGVLSGAAAGASIGGPPGAAIGGLIGGIGGLFGM